MSIDQLQGQESQNNGTLFIRFFLRGEPVRAIRFSQANLGYTAEAAQPWVLYGVQEPPLSRLP